MDEEAYNRVINLMRDWIKDIGDKADEPIFGHGHTDPNDPTVTCKIYSPRDILREVEQRTKFGLEYVQNLSDLAMRHILDAPTTKEKSDGESNDHDQR